MGSSLFSAPSAGVLNDACCYSAKSPHLSKFLRSGTFTDLRHLKSSGKACQRVQFPVQPAAIVRQRSQESGRSGEVQVGWIGVVLLSFLWCQTPSSEALVGPLLFETVGLARTYSRYDFLSDSERRASDEFSVRVSEAVALLEKGKQAQARGDFAEAFQCFDQITMQSGDLALAEYARVGRAISRYEIGDRGEAILEMEDSSISLKGYPEVHAALAAALYVDKHAVMPAEQQFTIATLMDPRYTDPSWVQENKYWPPSLMAALRRFISFQ